MSRDDSMFHVEQQILMTVMLRPSSLPDMAVLPKHFSVERHGELWEAILSLDIDSRPFDPIGLSEEMERQGRGALAKLAMQIGFAKDLVQASSNYPARTLVAAWRDREAHAIAEALADESRRREEGAVDRAITALMELNGEDRNYEHTAQTAMQAAWAEVVAAKEHGGRLIGVSTGLSALDDSLGGLHDSDLVVVGARPAMGKTGLLLGMTRAGAKSGPVGLISGEQPHDQVGMRWMAAGSHVTVGRLRAGKVYSDEDWSSLSFSVREFGDLPIRILDRSSPDIAEVVRVARRWKHQYGIKALYVDYLQRLEIASMARSPKHERVGAIARTLKNLARDLRIPVVVLAQVSRLANNDRPQMSQLSDSSEIEKEADQIMMLWRDLDQPDAKVTPAEINVVKNRHGNIGAVHCLWHGGSTSFVDKARDDMQAAA